MDEPPGDTERLVLAHRVHIPGCSARWRPLPGICSGNSTLMRTSPSGCVMSKRVWRCRRRVYGSGPTQRAPTITRSGLASRPGRKITLASKRQRAQRSPSAQRGYVSALRSSLSAWPGARGDKAAERSFVSLGQEGLRVHAARRRSNARCYVTAASCRNAILHAISSSSPANYPLS